MGGALGIRQGGQPTLLCCGAVCEGGVREGTRLLARLLPHFLSLPLLPTSGLCLFRFRFPGGWACICSRTLWVSLTDSAVRLGVSPAAATPTRFYSQRFWGFISPHWNPRLLCLSHSPVVPSNLSTCECGICWSTSFCPFLPSPLAATLSQVLAAQASCLRSSYQSGWMFL